MKLLIAADIHGSSYYCKKLLEVYEQERPERVLLLGDLLYHGPRNPFPKAYSSRDTADLLNSIADKILCIRGNCDSDVDTNVLRFPVEADFIYLMLEGRVAIACHGHKMPARTQRGDILINGHYHIPAFEEREAYTYINCGSVALPKDQSPHSCLILNGNRLYWKNLETGAIFMTKKLEK